MHAFKGPEAVVRRCSVKFQKIHWETQVQEPLQNTFFKRTFLVAASEGTFFLKLEVYLEPCRTSTMIKTAKNRCLFSQNVPSRYLTGSYKHTPEKKLVLIEWLRMILTENWTNNKKRSECVVSPVRGKRKT